MEKEDIEKLLQEYIKGTCSDAEKALLESWYIQQNAVEPISVEALKADLKSIGAGLPLYKPAAKISLFKRIFTPRIAAAAMLILTLSAGLFFYINNNQVVTPESSEILPGGNKAVLTLSNGEKISLTDAADGNIANQANVSITKTADGQLIYTIHDSKDTSLPPKYNTVETPNGGQFHIVLPDGTKVWLNAASSLRFPTYFAGKERKVELTGEGYFEVSKNQKMPFLVKTNKQDVEVLGTHFNVNAYADEEVIKTTLIEGSVKVKTSFATQILRPGQQSLLDGNSLSVAEVDTDVATAWKNGQFMFNDEHIEAIMRQISRWYNVDIEFLHKPSESKIFWGTISRFENVSQVLEILELTKSVKFKIEGRRIIVMK